MFICSTLGRGCTLNVVLARGDWPISHDCALSAAYMSAKPLSRLLYAAHTCVVRCSMHRVCVLAVSPIQAPHGQVEHRVQIMMLAYALQLWTAAVHCVFCPCSSLCRQSSQGVLCWCAVAVRQAGLTISPQVQNMMGKRAMVVACLCSSRIAAPVIHDNADDDYGVCCGELNVFASSVCLKLTSDLCWQQHSVHKPRRQSKHLITSKGGLCLPKTESLLSNSARVIVVYSLDS